RGRFDSLLRSSRRVCAFWCLIWLVRPVRQVASCFPLVSHLLQHCLWSRHTSSVPLQCGHRRAFTSTFFVAIYGFASLNAAANPCEHKDRNSASVSGAGIPESLNSGIRLNADLCRYTIDGLMRPGLTHRSSFGTSSQSQCVRLGMLNRPHRPVDLVHGDPYHHG